MYRDNFNVVSKQNRRKMTFNYLTINEIKEVSNICGDSAVVLLEYYLSRAGTPKFEYTDEKSAKALGWTKKKTQRNRLILTENNWYREARGKYYDGRKFKTCYIGKRAVLDSLTTEEDINLNEVETLL